MTDAVCGKCKYHKHDAEKDDWICMNPDSDYLGLWTSYEDWCYEWEEK